MLAHKRYVGDAFAVPPLELCPCFRFARPFAAVASIKRHPQLCVPVRSSSVPETLVSLPHLQVQRQRTLPRLSRPTGSITRRRENVCPVRSIILLHPQLDVSPRLRQRVV